MDMYPHIPTLAVIYAATIYALLYGSTLNFITILKTLPRIWLAALPILLAIAGLYCIEKQIFLFQPQHSRTAITVTANQIGQTAFTQPSALFGWLFPLSFAAGFEEIASRYIWKGFIYRLDLLLIYMGTIPLFLSLSLLFSNENRRAAFGWLLFTLVLAATSMQSTGLYLTIIHLPFFNIFRSYIHFWDYVFFSFLVLSAYGFESIIRCALEERTIILKKTFAASFAIYILGLTSLALFILQATGHGPGLRSYLWEITLDIIIIICSLVSISLGVNKRVSSIMLGSLLIVFLIITQTIYLTHMYLIFGETSEKTFARYQTNKELLTPISANSWATADDFKRIECEKASGCNLSQRPATSLKNNTDGSFFRDLNNPVLRKAIPDNMKSALTGITKPILWATSSISIIPSHDALDSILAKSFLSPQDTLSLTTYVVSPGIAEQLNESNLYKINANFSDIKISPNNISFSYNSNIDGYANLSLTANDGWKATINGFESTIIRSFYNYVTFKIPQGHGQVILEYSNNLDKYFFWSRYLLALLGILSIIYIIKITRTNSIFFSKFHLK
jgi:hypothetical protein